MAYRSLSPDALRHGTGFGDHRPGAHRHVDACGTDLLVLLDVLDFARIAGDCGHPVLLYGETGSGKTHLAREIHDRCRRAGKPFVRVNCAAIPDTLFEREMFGHVRGAFTDAREAGTGFFEAADGGTLFLDEIGEIPLSIQPKLLAVLEEGSFRRLGSPREVRVDVQIIAATNRDLAEMVRSKQFRQDLFYRFSVLKYRVPSLRERREDLPDLVRLLLRRNAHPDTGPPRLADGTLEVIRAYPWPGNIRELENALRAGAVFARGGEIQPHHLPEEVRAWTPPDPEGEGSCSGARNSGRYAAPGDPEEERGRRGVLTLLDEDGSVRRDSLLVFPGEEFLIARKPGMVSVGPSPFGRRGVFGVGRDGRIYYGWTDTLGVEVYSLEGRRVGGFAGEADLPEVTRSDIEEEGADLGPEFRRVLEAEVPDTWPAVRSLVMDDRERLWVTLTGKRKKGETGMVFTPSGSLLASVSIPDDLEIRTVRRDRVYSVEKDENGVPRVVIHRVNHPLTK
ncbi:MAG TPA: sigma 54-interacting transcriptional regulator [Longimicrobiaceae bacterium]|nr:sigma 54-interacting transcriptional regulator [Longimicrobiaceae bacterium]